MSQKVVSRQVSAVDSLTKLQEVIQNPGEAVPIPYPSSDIKELKEDGDTFTFDAFTSEDAFVLGNLLHARLLPHAKEQPAIISIALAHSHEVFRVTTGPGTVPENESWVRRKRNAVVRFGRSSWYLHCMFDADEDKFYSIFAIGPEKRGDYAIHGGGVPIKVKGVEGVVATVIVSGLKQEEDHGVIVDVIKENWK